ncbi:hemagglutinin repeat-containing protein [Undibacterium parvum]|uniref:Filamentous hemagglutinin N-terminal domain-containing protein n=2 Tax=Undibacterium TaxID=401469 RepID=A0A6M4A1G0_9BURK|nr:hemagglutinin repeat-containing protein [Undibacterium parvum]AZP14077.1 filamentous hemagglutinin N-terminal domain-containing protein [Undibacterium parvum]QJQ05025.1 filamentous hemagglutinin N-terminal domain-containing protein [Undibacterium piscinae]
MKTQQIQTTRNAEMIRPAQKPWVRIATKAFTVLYLWQSILPAYAQTATGNLAITPAASAAAGQRAIMDAALNGVPIAHIAPPSAAGVSRNQYDQFNVNQNGLILNNSANNVQSKLGGWISGNLQLGVTPARIILNEVISANSSQLRGTIEVAGQRADIVIANPNGISCDGCGFLNAGRSTLTTGSTQFAADGSIKGFDVRQGQITIGSAGLNAANIEQLDLMARGMVIEGEVWAKNLNAIAGTNQLLYGTLQAISQSGAGATPRFAIDIKELGGMYANQVYMVATERGLGVNSTGRIAALQGNLVLSANGDLSLKDSYAKQNIQIETTANANLSGQTVSDAAIAVGSAGALVQLGTMESKGPLTIRATSLDNQGNISQRSADAASISVSGSANNSGSIYSGGALALTAGSISDRNGKLLASGDLQLQAQNINLSGSQLASDGNLVLRAIDGGLQASAAQLNAGLNIQANASGAVSNTAGLWLAQRDIRLQAASLDNRGGTVLANGALAVTTSGVIDNSAGKLLASKELEINASQLLNNDHGMLVSEQAALITTQGLFSNQSGTVSAKTALTIANKGAALNNVGGIIASDAMLNLTTGDLNNQAGQISAGNKLNVLAGSIDNQQGKVLANQSITLDAVGLDNRQGQISGLSDVRVALSGSTALNNTLGSIVSNHDLSIKAAALNNTQASISAANAASLQLGSGTLDNHAGQVLGMQGLTLQSGRIDNQGGTIYTGKALAINTQGQQLDNTGGNIVSGGDLSITAAALTNLGGKLSSQSVTSITSQALDNTQGEISALKLAANAQSSGNLLIHTQGQQLKNDGGRIIAQGDLQLQSGSLLSRNAAVIAANGNAILSTTDLDTSAATLQAAQDLQITANGIVSNANGKLLAGRDLNIQATQLLQTGTANAEAGRDLTLNVTGALNNSGTVLARANAQINAGSINNDGGSIATAQSLTITSGKLENRSINGSLAGQIIGTTALTISSQALDNSAGVIGSQGDLLINTHAQELKNDLGIIRAQKALTLQAGDILNRGANAGTAQATGVIAANSQANILANNIDNTGGSINAGSALNINASAALTNNNGRMMSDGSSAIQAASLNGNNAGRITAASSLQVDAAGNLNNAGGLLIANGSVNINSAALTNTGGTLASLQSDQSINTHGQSLNNDAGKMQASGNLNVQAGSTSNQNAGLISAKDLSLNLGSLNNNGGQILAAGTLNANTLALSNNAGLIEAAGDATISTNGNALVNTNSASNAGIVSAAKLRLQTGDLNNQSGFIASSGNNNITSSGTLDNRTGLITSNAVTTVQAVNIDNRSGRLNAKGDLALNLNGALDNRGGNLTTNANALINAASLDNSSGTIDAGNLTLNANSLSNSGGVVRAANNATITAALVDNSNGTLTAKNTLVLNAPSLNNANGYLVADKELVISTASGAFGGSVASQNNVTLNIAGDYSNTGLLSAQKNLTVNASNINNSGVIKANDSFTANTGNLINSGEISATTTRLNLSGNLNNTGLIDGSTTQINANSIDNTGRIYGDQLSIQSGTLNNSGSGFLGARDSMFLGGGAVNNSNGASIYAYNDIVMAGSLAQNGQPLGELGSLLNASSNIEAGRNIDLSVGNFINRNDLIQTAVHTTNTPVNITFVQPLGSPTKYLSTELGIVPNCDYSLWCYVLPSTVYPIAQFGIATRPPSKTTQCHYSPAADETVCSTSVNYTANDAAWSLFKVAAPVINDLTAPSLPSGDSDCMTSNADSASIRNMSGACGSYWPAFDTYTQTVTQRTDAAYEALGAKIAAYNADVQSRVINRWTYYKITDRKTEETEITSTKPAQISAAGSISIQGNGSKLNDNSTIVAGGAIAIAGTAVINQGTVGSKSVTENGQVGMRDHEHHGIFNGNDTVEIPIPWVSYTGAPEVTSLVLSNYTYLANGGNTVASKTLAGSGALADASLAGSNAAASGNDRSLSAINVNGQLSSAGTVNQAGVSNLASAVAAQSIAIGSHSAAQAKAVDHSPLTILSIAASGTGERARDVILSLAPRLTLPNSSLFVIHPEPSSRTLIETDPRFTRFKTFISSDYYLQQLNKDPERQLKRYGDGFYEQQLINDQILALTGRRFLSGYSSTEEEYKQLMNSGVAFAQRYQLSPGVALSAEQMANLSTDIVWLSTQTVTLANGQSEQVLVPQVYLRRPQGGDLQTSGALISASDISIQSSGNLLNSGSINASGTLNLAAANDLVNQGGSLRGQTILARAGNDLKNLSGSLIGSGPDSSITLLAGRDILLQTRTIASSSVASATSADSSRTSIDRLATLQAGAISLDAGRDISAIGAKLSAEHNLVASAGRDLLVSAVQGQYQLQVATGGNTMGRSGAIKEASVSNLAASLSGENVLLLAQNDARISGSNLTAVNNLQLQAANIEIAAAKDRRMNDVQTVGEDHYSRTMRDDQSLVGGNLSAGNKLSLRATEGNISLSAANLNAQNGQTTLSAKQDINILNASTEHRSVDDSYSKSSGIFSSKTSTQSSSSQSEKVVASNVNGNSIKIESGKDLVVQASNVIASDTLQMTAGRDLKVISAEQSSHAQSANETKQSGFVASYSSGVASLGYSKANSAGQSSLDTVTQQASSIGSIKGSAVLKAGENLQVIASDIAAKENLNLIAKNIDLSAAQNATQEKSNRQSSSSGFAVGITVDPLSAFKDAHQASTKNSSSGGTIGKSISQGEGVADGITAATTAVVVQFGSRQSSGNQNQANSTARTSTLNAGKDLTIIATDGSISSQGTQMSADGNALILAKDSITFDVAHNGQSQDQNNKTSGFSFDNRSRLIAGSFNNKGKGDGVTDTITGTQLSVGGSTAMATDKGDIKLIAANVVSEGNLSINAAKNLTIQSGQDTVHNANQSDNKAIGQVVISDTERFAGYHNEKHLDNNTQITQIASNVSSLKGDVSITAADKYSQTASNVLAGNDIRITGKTIDITVADNTGSNRKEDSDLKIGAFARISSPLIDLVNNIEAARKSDGRLQAMQGMAAGANAYQAVGAVSGSGTLIKGEVGVGFASSNSSGNNRGSTAQASTINGAGNVTLTSTEGNIHATGANLSAGKTEGKTLSLDSAKDIVLDASQSGYHADGKNSSAGLEVGVGYAIGAQTGVYAYVAANVGNGHNNADGVTNTNTHLTANAIKLTSQGDTTLKGADAKANSISTGVAGKLAIESVQDGSLQESSQNNVGGRVQVSFGTAWDASGSVSLSKGSGSSNAVKQQSGLFAGDGGYHIKADSIDLKGGAITSTNAQQSELTANKLTTSNVLNKMDFQASSVSLAGGISGGSGAGDTNADGKSKPVEQQQLFGDKKGGNVTPGLPMQEKGSASSTTYATITDGNITIGGKATGSVKELGINTDAAKAHTALAAIPDIKVLLKDQQAMSAAAGTVIATSKQIAGDIAANAGKTQQAAQAVLDNQNSTAGQKEQAILTLNQAKQAQIDWSTGGDNSRALAVVTGILVGGVAGQGGTQLAANASAPYAAAAIGDYFKTKGNENQTLQDLSHAVLGATLAYANGASAVGGALAGGGAELAAQILTKQLYPDAFDANGKLQRDKLTPAQAANITALSSGIGALLSGVAGGTVLDAAVGGKVATNAVENNYLGQKRIAFNKPSEQAQFDAAVAACAKGSAVDCNTKNSLYALSQARDRNLGIACSGGPSSDCHDLVRLAQNAGNKVIFGNDGKAYIYPVGTPELVATPNAKDASFHDKLSKSTAEAVLLDIGGGATELAVGAAVKGLRWIAYGTTDAAKILDGGAAVAVANGANTVGAANRATFEVYKDGLISQMGKPTVSNPTLSGLIDDLYRPGAKIGSGSTADAVRYEQATGQSVGDVFHTQKANDYSAALQKWIDKNPTASTIDRAAAENVLRDLQNALKGK